MGMYCVRGKCPGSVDMISALAPDYDTACQRVLDSLKSIITECWAADPKRRPPSSEIMNRVFFQSDAQGPDASAPSEPPSIESVATVGFGRTENEIGEDQNTGRVALPTEHGSRDSHFTPSPISQDSQISPDDEPDVRESLPDAVAVKRSEGFICQIPGCGR
ncbi:hypothetical protein FS837_002650, partial [Tulasnella sp. UAMH 9824]